MVDDKDGDAAAQLYLRACEMLEDEVGLHSCSIQFTQAEVRNLAPTFALLTFALYKCNLSYHYCEEKHIYTSDHYRAAGLCTLNHVDP
jgi:hypothetical protein